MKRNEVEKDKVLAKRFYQVTKNAPVMFIGQVLIPKVDKVMKEVLPGDYNIEEYELC